MDTVLSIKKEFRRLLHDGLVIRGGTDESGDTVEIIAAQFEADEPAIFGEVSSDYVTRELKWYLSQSCNVRDIDPPIPSIWLAISGNGGEINSNYGWCIFSEANGFQYDHCLSQLMENSLGRKACMIYQRPSMHVDAYAHGMRDFICTDGVHVFVRQKRVRGPEAEGLPYDEHIGRHCLELHYVVYMRSNDAVFGYKNDLAWHRVVQEMIHRDLVQDYPEKFEHLRMGPITWNAASLHVYRRHFKMVRESE